MTALHCPSYKSLVCSVMAFILLTSTAIAADNDPGLAPSDQPLLNWLRSTVSPVTGLPFSFRIASDNPHAIYAKTGKADSVTGIIERLIIDEGLSVYDAAVWQIALTRRGDEGDLTRAFLPVDIYWHGHLGDLHFLHAGYIGQIFVYDPLHPEIVTADRSRTGERGFLFRIINANGHYLMTDPLDGKKHFADFPNYPDIHWEDWKPIAGENAWVVMAALQLYHKKYYSPGPKPYEKAPSDAVELALAREIARAALLLQAENGGIRMAPLGTYYHLTDIPAHASVDEVSRLLDEHSALSKLDQATQGIRMRRINDNDYPEYHVWYYEEISTENNLSWYAAFRMLYQITGDTIYRDAMERISRYIKGVWCSQEQYFYQGMHEYGGEWKPNTDFFATDVQNWSIVVLGPQLLDEWFGEGTAYHIWATTKEMTGAKGQSEYLAGVGFTKEHDQVSVEWTAGAILATRILADHYAFTHPDWAQKVASDSRSMRQGIEPYRTELPPDQAAYSYSSQRGWIPFGWFSHIKEVLSLVSTAWVVLIDSNINPFLLPNK